MVACDLPHSMSGQVSDESLSSGHKRRRCHLSPHAEGRSERVVLFGLVSSYLNFRRSGNPPLQCRKVCMRFAQCLAVHHVADLHALVLTTILDKLGRPSPDDPFNPDIAAVSLN